jgi:hypothetical protein
MKENIDDETASNAGNSNPGVQRDRCECAAKSTCANGEARPKTTTAN